MLRVVAHSCGRFAALLGSVLENGCTGLGRQRKERAKKWRSPSIPNRGNPSPKAGHGFLGTYSPIRQCRCGRIFVTLNWHISPTHMCQITSVHFAWVAGAFQVIASMPPMMPSISPTPNPPIALHDIRAHEYRGFWLLTR